MVCVKEEYTGLLLQQGGDITVCNNVVSVPIESLIGSRLPVFLLLLVQMFNLVMQKECL